MAYVIAEPCIGTKDNSCVEVCPVDCIHPTPDEPDYDRVEMLYIDPDECIDCDACVEACPVDACFAEDQLPDEWQKFAEINADYFTSEPRGPERPAAAAAIGSSAAACAGGQPSAARRRRLGAGAGAGRRLRPAAQRRQRDEAARGWRIACAAGSSGSVEHQRRALVGALAQRHRQRDLAEQRHVELVGQRLAAALAEDREALAARGDEARHVLDDAARSRG